MKLRSLVPAILLLGLVGCANLKVVESYAKDSACFASNLELATRYRDTYYRESPWLDAATDEAERATDAKRQASYAGLIQIQMLLCSYLNTLARLAGEDTTTGVINIGALNSNLGGVAQFGLDKSHFEAAASLTNLVTRAALYHKQKHAIQELVAQADPHVQKLVEAMTRLTRIYEETYHNEGAMVMEVLKFRIPATRDPQPADPGALARVAGPVRAETLLVNRLARAELQVKVEEYSQGALAYPKAMKGWAAVAEGHRQLKVGLPRQSVQELAVTLRPTANDLQTVRGGL